MELTNTRCVICDSLENYAILYKQNFTESDFNLESFSARRLPDRVHYQIVKCKKDNLIRSNPIVEQSRIYNLYRESKFTYEEEIENLTTTYLNALNNVLPQLSHDANILEIGCGSGFLLRSLYGMGYKNVFGIEPSIDAVKKADTKIQKKIFTDILRPNLFTPKMFDFIFFFQVFDHSIDPNAFLDICYNLLKPGRFILSFSHDVESLPARILGSKSPIIDIEHVYLYSKETIKKIFEKHFFLPIKIYAPVNIISLKHLLWFTPMPMKIKIRLLNQKGRFFCAILRKKLRIKLGNLCIIAKTQIKI